MANEQPDENLRVDCDGSKYTYVMMRDGKTHALRYGKLWIESLTHVPGNGMTLALASDLDEARKLNAELLAALEWFINDIDSAHTSMLDFNENVARSRAVLTKAKGQS